MSASAGGPRARGCVGSTAGFSAGNPAVLGIANRVQFGSCEDGSDRIPPFGKETRREFLYWFQPFLRPTLREAGHVSEQTRNTQIGKRITSHYHHRRGRLRTPEAEGRS